ncbi:nebulin isoform X14 [Heptranchias perlo]|uniref:nebulin isoform X14 n=1 Tax=Heptranchias perlo TaxID=212740 RepID=UPI00355A4830
MEDEEGDYEEYEEYEVEETVTVSEPHTFIREVSEPQTFIREVSEPHTIIREVSEPHTIIREVSEPHTVIREVQQVQSDSGLPVRQVRKKRQVDKSKFMTPYLEHSHKMKDQFSQNKYKEAFEKGKGKPCAFTPDTPELKRIRKAQQQLSEVKYRSEGDKAKTMCHVDGKARDIEHAKNVSQLVSKVLYKQKWEETKDVYQLPADAPELVRAVKFAEMFSPKLYKAAWEDEKTLYYPYTDSPELRRVASAQKALSDIQYKKGHIEQMAKYTSLADPPDVELARKVFKQRSDLKYHEDYNKNKGKWSQTPCYDVAIAKMNAENLSPKKYHEGYEEMKDQIYYMQTETPEYQANTRAKNAASAVKYRAAYEKNKHKTDYNTLPATENPLLQQLKLAGKAASDKLYKEDYEKARGKSINYCDTPKFKADKVLTNFSDLKYKQNYEDNIKGHYIGSHEDPYMLHCLKVSEMKSDKNYKADYEIDKTSCYFPQTVTPEYEAMKNCYKCKDSVYKSHPDKIKFTQVTDSPVMLQAQVNAKQLSDVNYKAKHEKEKTKCTIPVDDPFFIQSRVNAYNLSDNCYNYAWNKDKAKHCNIKMDAIPVIAAKAHRDIASDIKYKLSYEKSRGKHIGARSIQDDPKILHSVHVAKMQSEREYKKDYERTKTKYHAPLDMINISQAKKSQAIASNTNYKQPIHRYFLPPDSLPLILAKKSYSLQSDTEYKADYNSWQKGIGWVPYGSLDVEKAKKAMDILNEKKYRQPPSTFKFTSIDDSPEMVLAKINQEQRSDINYKAKGEKIIHKYTYPPDLPEFIQARVNATNASDNCYKHAWKKDLAKGYHLTFDAIPIIAAKSARHHASDVKYKKDYEQAKGKHVGFRSLQDDPKLVHSMHVAKIQSDREYKKDYEKSKTKYHTPVDMINITAAKKAQDVASNWNYKRLIHNYTCLPDAMSVVLSRNMMNIQSDNLYKSDYNNWVKGIGWIPVGSIDVEKVKKAGQVLNEKNYRQLPDTLKFTSVPDSVEMVLAKTNALQLNDKLYRSGGEKIKHKYTLPPDVPEFIQAKCNAINFSDNCYKYNWKESLAKGYHLDPHAISIIAAKASRNIASDYKYKEAYEKAKGKHVGFRSLQDDPKLVHYMQVAKIQSDREYKKDYEKNKTKYHTPVDMFNITAAKKAQDMASNYNYRHLIHNYTCLPDAMSVALSRNMMNIQSDNLYKQDYNCWQKGIGWIPVGSLEVEKVKKAGDVLSEHKYRQHPDTLKFTSVPDSMNMVLATSNTKQLSELSYKKSGEDMKHKYTLFPDYPPLIQAKINALNLSDHLYKQDWHKTLAKGYDMRADAIPIIAARASRNIASNYRYKEAFEKEKGKQVGFRSLQDDPKLVHSMHVAKIQSDREYKKDYEKSKTKYHTPVDMINITAAKKAQEVASNCNYKRLIHNYTYLPDAISVVQSRNMMNIQSDNNYKMDYNTWVKGIGWVPIGSLDVEKAKKATEIASESKYRQPPDKLAFTSIPDSLEIVLAKSNAQIMNKKLYTEAWDKDKNKTHITQDIPEIVLSKSNQMNMSEKLYRSGWEDSKKKGYHLMPDAISIKAAKATRDIASDYKYKLAYEKERGKHIGFRSLQDDPKLVHFMHVAKQQSDREYKKDYEKFKTKYNTPLDMFSITAAKKSQEAVSNINYKKLIHHYVTLPDSLNVQLAKNMMNIQSDNLYKSEFTGFMKGTGWIPIGSLEEEKNMRASNILSEKKYRQHPEIFKYTIDIDSMPMELAKVNAKIMNMHLYKEDWEKDKTQIHVMPDTPEITLAKVNQYNMSQKMYKQSMEEEKKKGCDLRADAIPIKAAKASTDIASNYKYKHAYEKARGRHIGFRSLQDDPKLVHCMHVAKMQSDREYKKDYEKSKTKYHTPMDMFSVIAAKKSQEVATNANYRQEFHNFTYLPDAMSLELSRKMMQIQSDNNYKSDLQWLKGIGWTPIGSLDVEKAKKATEIVSDKNYRQRPNTFKFTSLSDSMEMVLAKTNSHMMKKNLYTEAWEKDKNKVHVMSDFPDIVQAKANAIMISNNKYKLDWEQSKKKGYDLTPHAISITAAKASTNIASDYKYKTAYRKQLGHHVGFRNIKDDPKLVWSMHLAKIQSDREYKKDFEKTKTKFNMPVDMLNILLAKKCQNLVSDIDYRRYLHQWTCLPDQTDVIQAHKAYDLQSDNLYKADLQWLKGTGWSPIGSLDVVKAKKAGEILSEAKYRQSPSTLKFTSLSDSMDLVLAKNNAHTLNKKLYTEAWEKDKIKIHITSDIPEILQAKANTVNISEKMYKLGYEELKKKGYDLTNDAISIKAAKASRDIASDYKYKTAYRKQLGHHVGFRNIKDDPKLVWSMHVAKIQSDREYKKDFEKTRTNFNMPVDMLDILLAKKCQTLVSDIDYRRYLHQWTCLPDQTDVIQAKKAYDLQSDNLYKADLQWLKGIGWSPLGSLDVAKAKKAGEILSEANYRQSPTKLKFTSLPDSMDLTLAKNNAHIMNKRAYTEAWEADKTNIHVMPDIPEIILAKQNQITCSEKLYKLGVEEAKKKGHNLHADAISIKAAKASSDIASDYKYKTAYRKQLGHHVGCRNIQDDPKMVWSMHVAKIQSDREYKKDFQKSKTKYNVPVDMLDILLAKKCQTLVSDIDYRRYLHQWTCLPDQTDVIQARKAYDLQSDILYKSDLQWLKGIGWTPSGSLEVENVKKAGNILSEKNYRQPPDTFKFTSLVDSMPLALAKANSHILNQHLYTEAWERDKINVHIMPDAPEFVLASQNQLNFSNNHYRHALEESKKKGYDLRSDAISIKAAKASRDIASDYKYKTAYRKQLGHHVGCRNIQDDPKMVWSMHVAKIQSDREYKKDFQKSKTKYNIPADMLDILLAKKCQTLVSDIDYRRYLHQWTCLPDQTDVIQARKAYDLQSDILYKSDLQWLKGIGWTPSGSLEVENVKKAGNILSEKNYRQPPDTFKFTSLVDSMPLALAKANSHILNQHLYTEAWERDKIKVHIMPDAPEFVLASQNQLNFSNNHYRHALEESKKKGYDLRSDAISIKAAKASRDIASDYKYKTAYRKQLGHHVGCRNIQDDPKMVWSMHVAKIQSDREYKKDFQKSKTKYNIPVDMLDILLAKKCQTLVSDIDYRHHLHQWTCLPDQNDVIQARKAYDLQSDWLYKSDMEWIRGCGWMPNGSLDVKKVQKAQEILSERLYRQPPDQLKFTSIADLPSIVLAKINSDQISDRLYRSAWEKDKLLIHLPSDTPEMVLSKQNSANISSKLYKQSWEDAKKKGYDLRPDAISIKAAKASNDIASDYKYKAAYRKQLGHHVGCRDIHDDPKMVWSMHVAKIQSDREYKKDFQKSKTKYNIPVDMLEILLAKKCQTLVSDIDYRQYLHQWTCLPDQNDVIQAKKAYDLQSDWLYKSDMEWIRGCGWMPNGSLDVKKVQKAQEILSERLYRQPPNQLKFTSIVDEPSMVLAKTNAYQISDMKYKEAWEKDKQQTHILPDTPEILLAKSNATNISQKLYKEGWEDMKKTIDYRADAISIKSAKASRNIASDYKYKEAYRQQLGHHIGCLNVHDDPKMVWSMHVAKIQSDKEYKKDFQKSKTKYNIPADMLEILLAKKCQNLVSDIDYRQYLHQWTCLPDQNDVIQARKAYDLQSDINYKSDMEWLRGVGWIPTDSIDVKKVKHAQDILSDRNYRTKVDSLQFTPVTDRIDYVAAKHSSDILNDVKYREAWHASKTKYTLVDSPTFVAAREAAKNLNEKLYKQGWENLKATGYKIPVDAVSICHAKSSQGIQSELKYKAEYANQLGHHIGCRDIHDDPKMVWCIHAGKIQSDRHYKKDFEKSKTKFNIPVDMLEILSAKKCQTLVSDIDYRHYLHEWTCLPDQNDVIQARKAYDLQSDFVYKSDLEWIRGCGWIPLDSVEHQKVKKAQEILNDRAYKENAVANFAKFTSITDLPEVVQAKINSNNLSDLKYKETFNLEKGKYIGAPDTPELARSREMAKHVSQKFYKDGWESSKATGYTLPPDYLPLVVAKHAENVSSDLKYKELYEKLKGHYLAGGDIKDFPAVIQALAVDKMRNMLDYRKDYEDTKCKVHIPNDMISHVVAKKCQQILSDIEYRTYYHHWTCLPDEHDVIRAKRAQEILSDFVYKDDLNWLKGLGCYAWDTPEILRAKEAYELQSDNKYRIGGKKNFENYTVVTDTPVYLTAVQSGLQLSDIKYKEQYEKMKDKYTTVLDTVDYKRTNDLKSIYSSNAYKLLWDKVKATSYSMPGDAFSIALAKNQKYVLSPIKYREEYEKFKALYTLPRSVEDDPHTLHCLNTGKLILDRLYRGDYERNKMKIHILPDMLEVVAAKETQAKVSEIDYRKYLHEWTCLPDLQINIHARKVNNQLSDVLYKDDLTWLKGIGCNVWDTPEILHAKKSYDLQSDIQYKAKAEATKNQFTPVMNTPTYLQAVTNAQQLSDLVYRNEYVKNIKGTVAPFTKTVELERARGAYKIQSENLYRDIGRSLLPTGYTLPADIPFLKHARNVDHIRSDLKYKEAYEHMKARGYTLIPDTISITSAKKADDILNQRLYRLQYETNKDKIHPAHDTPAIRQVKATQEAISDLSYKSDYFRHKGQKISLPTTPELMHHRYVGDITSDNRYKEDLRWLKGIGCFLYGTPEMIRVRDFHKFWTGYDKAAKKIRDQHTSILDTPEYRRVTELKTHLSNLVYRAQGNKTKTKYTTTLNTVDLNRAKHGQKIQSQYLYVELATKDRPHYTPHTHTPALDHAKHVKHFVSEKKYKEQYEKMKSKYTSIPDSPTLLVSKHAYIIASDLRYKEAFEHAKGHYRTVKDALNIVYHRKVTDDISDVKYREKYIQQLGLWRSIADPPEHFHHRMVTDAISSVKYKSDLDWLKGIGCYAWDTPDFMLAEKNKKLYSQNKYRESVAKYRNNFKYTADTPHIRHAKEATAILDEQSYKCDAKNRLRRGCNEILRPEMLTAICNSISGSQWNYKKDYEKVKDKYTSILETPENIRTKKVTKLISDIKYKLNYNQNKAKGYTAIHDTPMLLHMRKVKDRISDLKYREIYEKNKANCTIAGDAFSIRAAKSAYKNTTNLDYKKKYEANKAKWMWTADRPDFMQAYKASQQQSDVEYKLDREYLKGCKLSVPVLGDKNLLLAVQNTDLASGVKYRLKHEKERGIYQPVPDTPQMLHAKSVSTLMSEKKYKEAVKKELPHAAYMTLPETRGTSHVKAMSKLLSGKLYKEQFEKEKGKSSYSIMMEPPEVKHAMDVAKSQSNIEYKKEAKSKLAYSSVADRPDIMKATEAAKLISDIGYRTKAREEASRGIISLGRPDIELAKEVSKLTSQVEYTKQKLRGHGAASYDTPTMRLAKKANILTSDIKYKEKFDKEVKGKRPKFDLKESSGYQTMKDANILASEIIYKQDLKKMHKPVTDMSESLQMQHNLSTSKLSSQYQYKKEFEKSRGHYQLVSDTPEQIHLKEATELQSQVKYKEKYEKEKGKAMLDFETPVYLTAKESQHMQSEKEYKKDLEETIKGRNLSGLEITPAMLHVRYATKIGCEKEYRKDLEQGVKGKGLTGIEETPEMLRAKNATYILNEKEYKKALEEEIKGKGLVALANETPDFARAKNATDILSQVKYKHLAEKDRSNYTTVIDTPDIIHAQHVRNLTSQKQYKAEAVKTMSHYVPVIDTPEMHRVRENQKNISTLQYTSDLKHIKGKVTTVKDTPEILRAKENQKNFSLIAYKEEVGTGTSIKETPEMERVKRTQEAISSIKYKESIGQGTAISDLPEVKRIKETQKNISSIKYKESIGQGTAISDLPEVHRVKEAQKNISSVLYKEHLGKGTPVVYTPEMQRVKRNQENISSVLYSDSFRKQVQGRASYVLDTPEMRRVRDSQRNISTVKYHEDFEKTKGSFTSVVTDPITERVKKNMQDFSDLSYRGIQRRVVEMQRRRVEQEGESLADLRVWRTNPGSVFDYDPAEDNIQSRSLHLLSIQAQRRSREHSRSASALSLSGGDEKSDLSEPDHTIAYYNGNNFFQTTTTTTGGYQHAKTTVLPQQRSSSVATQQTTVSSIPSHPSTTGKTYRAIYDYAAADADEVSFKDGDVLMNVQSIDEGWMYGTVQRTGLTGMLPANYVDAI